MAATQTDPPLSTVQYPRLSWCRDCGADVLLARWETNGRIVILDAWPVIARPGRCSACKGKGERLMAMYATGGKGDRSTPGDLAGRMVKGSITRCPECGGTGQRGEPLTRQHVVMRLDGIVRGLARMVEPWDSAYRRHRCGV
jgi:hypothetical protein